MTKPALIALDTETGGFDYRIHPLLSIAIGVADAQYNLIDGFEIKIKPPKNTYLEIPAPGSFGKSIPNKRKACYMNVWTKERVEEQPNGVMIIGGMAAEVNGYIGPDDLNWDLSAIDRWHAAASEITEAENDLITYLTKGFGPGLVVTAAHNVSFDTRFVSTNMPRLTNKLMTPWFCTMESSRAYHKKTGVKASAKLVDMAKLAGHDYKGKAHQAFADVEAALAVLRFLKSNGM